MRPTSVSSRRGMSATCRGCWRLSCGWRTSWDIAAIIDGTGNVAIDTPAGQRTFVKQADGSFHGRTGDPATLTLIAGEYRLKTTAGQTLAFSADGKLKYVEDRNSNRV